MSAKPKYANDCKWCDLKTGLCGNPNKYRGKKTQIIAGQEVDVTWSGRCLSEDMVIGLAAGNIYPPLACDEAERMNGGNGAKMREALESIIEFDASEEAAMADGLTDAERIFEYADHIVECQKKAKAALAEPRRNCDVGSAEEQAKRYGRYCNKFTHCKTCPCYGKIPFGKCEFAWAQMPYEEGGEG